MDIIIVGCGMVGLTLAEQLCREGHAITMVDTDPVRLEDAVNSMDVQAILGNGTSHQTLLEAGVAKADLLIAVTDHDEMNMIACLIGKKVGGCQTMARVRDPGYYEEIKVIGEELGLSLAINPEWAAAQDIFRLLQIPSALDVDTFDKGKVNMIRFRVETGSPLDGKKMMELGPLLGGNMLICIRERNGEVTIPDGRTDLMAGDNVSVVMPMDHIGRLLHKLNIQKKPIHSATIAGGDNTAVYLAGMLLSAGMQVKIIEKDMQRCKQLADVLPKATIIHGDSTDKKLLMEEGLPRAEAFVALTDLDEENIMLALYAGKVSGAKLITKISRIDFEEVISDLPLGSVVYPKNITAENIVRYVRAMDNAAGNNVQTLYRLLDGRVEALEFEVHAGVDHLIDVPLKDLRLKDELLLCSINRGGRIITPTGSDRLEMGDVVIVVTTHKGLRDLRDILE